MLFCEKCLFLARNWHFIHSLVLGLWIEKGVDMLKHWLLIGILISAGAAASLADMQQNAHRTISDFEPAWSPGQAQPLYTYQIDRSQIEPSLVRSRLQNSESETVATLPDGQSHSNLIFAHGHAWIAAQRNGRPILFSLNASSANRRWSEHDLPQLDSVDSLALNDSGDPVISGREAERPVRWAGRFTGGGAGIKWNENSGAGAPSAFSGKSVMGEFDIDTPGTFLALSWEPKSGADLKVQYRVSPGPDEPYNAWSQPLKRGAVQLNTQGRFLQYRFQRSDGARLSPEQYPEIEITHSPSPEQEPGGKIEQGGSGGGLASSQNAQDDEPEAAADSPTADDSENAPDSQPVQEDESPQSDDQTQNEPQTVQMPNQPPSDNSPESERNPTEQSSQPESDESPASADSSSDDSGNEQPESMSPPADSPQQPEQEAPESNEKAPEDDSDHDQNDSEQDQDDNSGNESNQGESGDDGSAAGSEDGQANQDLSASPEQNQSSSSGAKSGHGADESGAGNGSGAAAPQDNGAGAGADGSSPEEPGGEQDNQQPSFAPSPLFTPGSARLSDLLAGPSDTAKKESGAPDDTGKRPQSSFQPAQGGGCQGGLGSGAAPQGFDGSFTPEPGAGMGWGDTHADRDKRAFRTLLAHGGGGGAGASGLGSSASGVSSRAATPEISDASAPMIWGSSFSYDSKAHEKPLDWRWLAILALLGLLWAAHRRLRRSDEFDEPLVVNEEDEPAEAPIWLEEAHGGEGAWERIMVFAPHVAAVAENNDGAFAVMSDGSVWKGPALADLVESPQNESDDTRFQRLAKLDLIDPQSISAFENGLAIVGRDGKGRLAGRIVSLKQRGAVSSFACPKSAVSLDRAWAQRRRLWLRCQTLNGPVVYSAYIDSSSIGSWVNEAPSSFHEGLAPSVSNSMALFFAGAPGNDAEHLWLYSGDSRHHGRMEWKPLAKAPFGGGDVFLFGDAKKCFMLEVASEASGVQFHVFGRGEDGGILGRFSKELNLPHSAHVHESRLTNGRLVMAGREPESNRVVQMQARMKSVLGIHSN